MPEAFAEIAELYGIDASRRLNREKRARLGQYMTPTNVGRFLASLFTNLSGDVCVVDPGAGVGSLTAALVERMCMRDGRPRSVHLVCYEIEPLLTEYLQRTLKQAVAEGEAAHIKIATEVREKDFVLDNPAGMQASFLDCDETRWESFTHAIINPPYKKIGSLSEHRAALRKWGIETSNLYTGFLFLAAQQLCDGGEMVAIVPRSFCNGPYFKHFRQVFFKVMGLKQIHIFEKRNSTFRGDGILQENIVLHAIKGRRSARVKISASEGDTFDFDPVSREYVAAEMTERTAEYASVIQPDDPDCFVRIAVNDLEQSIADRMTRFKSSLTDLGVEVSTGPVVEFRLKADLRVEPESDTAPLLFPAHFRQGKFKWPRPSKKPNAIRVTDRTRKWLWPNEGYFVVTKRFTSKEERRRIVASVCPSDVPGELIGFENHLNVFHIHRKGFSLALASGLAAYLNSSMVDRYFRQFNGHTQVNATDLRSLRYPTRGVLERIGTQVGYDLLSDEHIETIVDKEWSYLTEDDSQAQAQQNIDDALEILLAIGMPRGQLNERSALTLLALLDLKPIGTWNDLRRPLIGITPVMEFARQQYGREYAPNTRETFRRQTMHQFVEAGIALYNPDDPNRPVNSPLACYQISEDAFRAIQTYGTDSWQRAITDYLAEIGSLTAKWEMHRAMQMIPVKLDEHTEIMLTPGEHSELIEQIITEFAPRFAPGSKVVYVGDTGDKVGYFQDHLLADLGVTLDPHGKFPDVVLSHATNNWLLLIESVTSHGPVDPKRYNELAELFGGARASLVYVTAFPDRTVMARYLRTISWETEVWCADSPSHLIHFDGEKFLGPYEG
jgi:adenine-specific DNA-methyltransferase